MQTINLVCDIDWSKVFFFLMSKFSSRQCTCIRKLLFLYSECNFLSVIKHFALNSLTSATRDIFFLYANESNNSRIIKITQRLVFYFFTQWPMNLRVIPVKVFFFSNKKLCSLIVSSIINLSSSWFLCFLLRAHESVWANINWRITMSWAGLSFSSSVIWSNGFSRGELSTTGTFDGISSFFFSFSTGVAGGIGFKIWFLSFFWAIFFVDNFELKK